LWFVVVFFFGRCRATHLETQVSDAVDLALEYRDLGMLAENLEKGAELLAASHCGHPSHLRKI